MCLFDVSNPIMDQACSADVLKMVKRSSVQINFMKFPYDNVKYSCHSRTHFCFSVMSRKWTRLIDETG